MFDGRIAIVTGGATGIGGATSRLLARHGAHVVVTSEQPGSAMAAICAEIAAAGGTAEAITCDVTSSAAITALVAEIDRRHGRLDILVNCAGIYFHGPLEQMPEWQIDKMVAINAVGPILLTRAALPVMRRGGSGSIINIASGAAVLGVEQLAVYAATKAALAHFTRTFAPELRGSGIRINTVAPGSVRTPMLGYTDAELTEAQVASQAKRAAASYSPYGNAMMDPDDIAQVILFLASDAARGLHGSLILADQGISSVMRPPG